MNENLTTYQTIIEELSNVPSTYFNDILFFIKKLKVEVSNSKNNSEIIDFAGSWNEFSNQEFEELNDFFANQRSNIFDREIEL